MAQPQAAVMLDFETVTIRGLARDARGRWRLAPGSTSGELLLAPYEHRGATTRVTPSWIAQWTAPLRFEKYPANPVYGPRQSGPWDSWTNGVSIVPDAGGKTYRMYYAGKAGEGIGFAEASVDDPLTWREHPASPVLRPRADNWEGNQINQPRVVAVTDQHYGNGYGSVGYAEGVPETGVNLFARSGESASPTAHGAGGHPSSAAGRSTRGGTCRSCAELWSRVAAVSPTLNGVTLS